MGINRGKGQLSCKLYAVLGKQTDKKKAIELASTA